MSLHGHLKAVNEEIQGDEVAVASGADGQLVVGDGADFDETGGWVSIAADRTTTDAAITNGDATLTSATAAFTAGDVGRTVIVTGAGAGGTDLTSTIKTYTSATSVELANVARTTVTAAALRVVVNNIYAYTAVTPTTVADLDEPVILTLVGAPATNFPVETRVDVWSADDNDVVVEYVAQIILDGQETGDPVEARLDHALIELLPQTIRADGGDSVTMEWDDDDLVVVEVNGKRPRRNGTFIDPVTLPPNTSDGHPPLTSPTPMVTGSLRTLFVTWDQVDNTDPVSYDVYVSDTSPVVLDAAHLLATETETNITAIPKPAGTYYVVLVARDADGPAAPSAEASGTVEAGADPAVLADNTNKINTLNTTTIPNMQTDITTAQGNISTLQGKFPITTTSITDGAISTPKMTANAINGDRITANTLDAAKIVAGSVTTDRMTANSINGDRIVANTIDAAKIVAGSITTDRMSANSINGDRIAAGTLTADKIVAGSITATQLSATAIDGKTITGATITGGSVTAGTSTTVTISSVSGLGNIRFNTSGGAVNLQGAVGGHYIYCDGDFVSAGVLSANTIQPYGGGSITVNANLDLGSGHTLACGYTTLGGDLNLQSNVISICRGITIGGTGAAGLTVNGGGINVPTGAGGITTGSLTSSGFVKGDTVFVTGLGTSATSANVNMNTTTGQLTRGTSSSLRYKDEIRAAEIDPVAALALEPKSYLYNQPLVDRPADYRLFGFIAEQAEELGLDYFVGYDEQGRPDFFEYGHWVVALQVIVRHLADQNQALTERVTALEAAA